MTAQWDDDVHHALHVVLTGEAQGYYADFAQGCLAKVLTRAFLHDGLHVPRSVWGARRPARSTAGGSSSTCRPTTRSATAPRRPGLRHPHAGRQAVGAVAPCHGPSRR